MSRVAIIVQARTGSSRLPGKVLLPLLDRPMLERQLERLRRCRNAQALVVATSTEPVDEPIADLVETLEGVHLCRGSEDDVLARYGVAAEAVAADVVVRITGDCPLHDPAVVDQHIERMLQATETADYVSNVRERTFARGLDTEVFRRDVLAVALREADSPHEREHVTPFFYENPQRFRVVDVHDTEDHSDLRLTVDTPEDFRLVEAIYEALYPSMPHFGYRDVLDLMNAYPSMKHLNEHVAQKGLRS